VTRFDIVVAGGGSAGLAAAVAAARSGAETLLIERGGLLGGMGASAFVHTICGLYQLRKEPEAIFANDGFSREFACRLIERGGAAGPIRMGRVDVLPHDPVHFAALADEFVAATPRLRTWLHTELIGATRAGNHLESAEVVCRGRRKVVESGAWIDATGDAVLTVLADASYDQVSAERLQRPAYIVLLRGCAHSLFSDDGRLKLAHALAGAVRSGELPPSALGAAFRPGSAADQVFLTIDLAGGGLDGASWDPLSPDCLAEVEMTGRRTALAIVGHFQSKMTDLSACRVAAWPARAGVRESGRIAGVYELSGGDILRGREFDDGVVTVAWPLEFREKPVGPRWQFPREGQPARVPLRCLRHRDVVNLWAAGRCLSASHEAQASIRVIGTCLATGEAAGLAAVESLGQSGECEWNWPALADGVSKRIKNLPRTI
jgi:hypothetical protein